MYFVPSIAVIHTLTSACCRPQRWFTHWLLPTIADHKGDSHMTSASCRLQRDFKHWQVPCVKSTALQQQSDKDTAQSSCHGSSTKSDASSQQNKAAEEQVELVTGQVRAQVVNKGMDLTQPKHTQCLQNTPSYLTQHTHIFIFDTAQTHLCIWHSPKHPYIWNSPKIPSYLTQLKCTIISDTAQTHLYTSSYLSMSGLSMLLMDNTILCQERKSKLQITLSKVRKEQVTHR